MSDAQAAPAPRSALLTTLPVIVFGLMALVLGARLWSGDPAKLPSALIGKSAPPLNLPGLDGAPGISDVDLHSGHVTLVNIFGSWCVPCRDEAPLLMALAHDPKLKALGVDMLGVAQKDKPEAIKKYLAELGNPYAKIGLDPDGRAGIDWGVYGVPETFIVDGRGMIAFKHVGPLAEGDIEREILPAVEKAGR